jgi:hypothetical protein
MRNLSPKAYFVLAKMQTGVVLVGAISDHGRPFRLGLPGAETWKELVNSRRIKVVNDLVSCQEEYRPA